MKQILVLLALLPFMAQAQLTKVTEEQMQQALRQVTDFCNLFTQWCNGQRTLDTRIYALCSGNDCSAYDDVSTNKETTLRNYLLGIQKKYPKSLALRLSQPSVANCEITYEPELSLNISLGTLNGDMDPNTYGYIASFQNKSYKNAYIVFKVNHSFENQSIGNRYIVYDLNARKISAYILWQGTYMSFLEGLNLMVKGEYKNAIQKFEIAASNPRASLKHSCYSLSGMCSAYLLDYQSVIRYGRLTGNVVLSKYSDVLEFLLKENFTGCLMAINECEKYINQPDNTDMVVLLPTLYHIRGVIYSLPNEFGHHYSPQKSVENFKNAIKLGNLESAYELWKIYICDEDEGWGDYLSDEEMMHYLEWAGEKGHLPCILWIGSLAEVDEPADTEKAIKWYTKGANFGDPICMARLGKILINRANRDNGRYWLRKSLEGNKLEIQLKAYEDLLGEGFWPKSRSDIQKLLDSSGTSSSMNNPSNTTTSSYSSYHNSSNSTSTYNNSYSYHKKRYRGPFNKAKDNYVGGFSMGYIQKQWVVEYDDGYTEKLGAFDDDKYMSGIQVGFRADPQFVGGLGMNTGLFYEYCWAKSKDEYDEYGAYHFTYEEHGLYLPLHLKFTMNFSKWFQLSFFGGGAMNYVISGKMYLKDDEETYDSANVFSYDDWRRWNFMFEYGVSIRMNALQFDLSTAKGLNDWSDTNGYKIKQGRPLTISMTICV